MPPRTFLNFFFFLESLWLLAAQSGFRQLRHSHFQKCSTNISKILCFLQISLNLNEFYHSHLYTGSLDCSMKTYVLLLFSLCKVKAREGMVVLITHNNINFFLALKRPILDVTFGGGSCGTFLSLFSCVCSHCSVVLYKPALHCLFIYMSERNKGGKVTEQSHCFCWVTKRWRQKLRSTHRDQSNALPGHVEYYDKWNEWDYLLLLILLHCGSVVQTLFSNYSHRLVIQSRRSIKVWICSGRWV